MRGSAMRRLALCGLAALLSPPRASADSVVLDLVEDTFQSAVRANPLLLVKFYAPWCGHCKQLAPEYEKAAVALKGRVQLAQVDATVEVGLAEQYRIEGYPMLYFFKNGEAEEYGGGRSNASIVQWVEEHSGPALVTLANEDAVATTLSQRETLPYFVAKGGQSLKELFHRLADERRAMGSFFFLEQEGSEVVQVHRGFGEVVELHGPDASSPDQVLGFLESEQVPPFGEIGEENYAAYLPRASQGMIWVCFSPDTFREDAKRERGVFQRLATTFQQFPVVYTDTKVYEDHVREELGCTEFPMLVLQLGNFTDDHAPDPKRYKLRLERITEETISGFIRDALDGKVPEDDGLDDLDEPDEEEEEEDEEGGGKKEL